ncbi:hypothetical protein CASFOL_040703 [Castilleja foliolosa]|uniref:Uncharacterized protein n=1 Tax=Castilleja foliolosa TaxID=1961234 RepID=A0ABD3BCK5_9LAMI
MIGSQSHHQEQQNGGIRRFHNVTAIVGAGVLGLPYAMSEMGCY